MVPDYGGESAIDIKTAEPLAITFCMLEGRLQIKGVYSDRDDFHRELPHTNPVSSNSPVSLCLSRDGLSTLFHSHGILGVIKTASRWMYRARAGELEHDGWEPAPSTYQIGLMLDISAFQKHAFDDTKRKSISSLSRLIVSNEDQDSISPLIGRVDFEIKNERDVWQYRDKTLSENISAINSGLRLEAVPVFYCWGGKENEVENRHLPVVNSALSLYQFAEIAGSGDEINRLLNSLVPQINGENPIPYFIVLVGVWRPRELIQDIPGLASGEARRLELFAFCSEAGFVQGQQRFKFYPMEIEPNISSELLHGMTGYQRKLAGASVIGCGALGSKVVDQLAREGCEYLSLIDHDRFLVHNVARHTLDKDNIWLSKAKSLKVKCNKLGMNNGDIRARNSNVLAVHGNSLMSEIGGRATIVIDTTASQAVQHHLQHNSLNKPIVNCSMALGGQLGLIAIEGRVRNPRVDDVKATLMLEALGEDIIAQNISNWLCDDEDDHEVRTGMTCASATMKMPDHRVTFHAANFMSRISTLLRDNVNNFASYGVTVLDDEGALLTTKWENVPEFESKVIEVDGDSKPWSVHIHPDVAIIMKEQLEEARPNEVGGYLYGTTCIDRRSIVVVKAIPVKSPDIEDSTPTHLVVPPAGRSHEERWLLKRTGGKLQLVGAWHTHPSSGARMSATDVRQKLNDACGEFNPRPFVHYIQSTTEYCVDISYPVAWNPEREV